MHVYNSGCGGLRAGAIFRYWLARRRTAILKFLLTSFLILVVAAPALAKRPDVYPVSCNDLWAAVHDTLDNPRNYGVVSMDDFGQRARFVVIGARGNYTQTVNLKAKDGGCAANATIIELGPHNMDWRQFQHRLAHSLARLQAAKPKPAAASIGLP